MARKTLIAAALALVALVSTAAVRPADAHHWHGGYYWGYYHPYHAFHYWGPHCWVNYWGYTVCR
jgi:hypothetical protein